MQYCAQYKRRLGGPRRISASVRACQKAQALATVLLWHDDLTDEQIVARCGVSRRTLSRWKQHLFVQKAFYAYQAAWNVQWRREAVAAQKREADALIRSFQVVSGAPGPDHGAVTAEEKPARDRRIVAGRVSAQAGLHQSGTAPKPVRCPLCLVRYPRYYGLIRRAVPHRCGWTSVGLRNCAFTPALLVLLSRFQEVHKCVVACVTHLRSSGCSL
jgi:hypothetical protein